MRTKYFPNAGDPNGGTYRYKIQVRDTCGNYSALSAYHNTIYMTNSSGNFSWAQLYTIKGSANPVSSYVLMRDDFNNGNWNAINSVSGTQQNVTDPAYAAWQATANWRISTLWNISCTPTIIKNPEPMGTIRTTKSNSYRTTGPISAGKISLENSVSVFPNPFAETTTLRVTNGGELRITNLKLFDVLGQEQKVDFIRNSAGFVIRRSNLVAGIYFLKIISDMGTGNKKIVITR